VRQVSAFRHDAVLVHEGEASAACSGRRVPPAFSAARFSAVLDPRPAVSRHVVSPMPAALDTGRALRRR